MKKNFFVLLTLLLIRSITPIQMISASEQENHEAMPMSQNLPAPEVPGGGSNSKYYFNKYVYVSGGKYTKRPSSNRIWQVAYYKGIKYAGWVTWTGKYKWVGYGVYNYQFTGFLNKVK